jgi:hypothetical protein
VVNGFPTAVWKRIEALEKAIRFRAPRIVVVSVPSNISDAALAELERQHAITDSDLLVCIKNFTDDTTQSPQLVSST